MRRAAPAFPGLSGRRGRGKPETAHGAGEVAEAALRTYPDLKGIYLTSAGADRVVTALTSAGRAEIVFITHELTDDRRALLRARRIHAVVDQDPSTEVQSVADTMARLLGRADGTAATVLTPVRIFTAENC